MLFVASGVALISIARSLETANQLSLLLQVECAEAQGFYRGRPVVAAAFHEALRSSP